VNTEASHKNEYGGIDRFRIFAAILIVGIHTYPLATISETANFYLIHVLGRVAVPFFLMVTGYFLLPRYFIKSGHDTKPLMKFVKKTGIIYALATLLYLPVSIYAGHYAGGNIFAIAIRNIIFDGTFYHLWYLPAVIVGVLLVYVLRDSLTMAFSVGVLLYIVGLFGDNYYGLISGAAFIGTAYEIGFRFFSFTRNGIFYAPVFLVMGAAAAKPENRIGAKVSIIGLIASLSLMMLEGYLLQRGGVSRHSSMYITLLPAMFFLFNLLLCQKGKASVLLRSISMWVFILHPIFIIAVRGLARSAGLTHILVDNSVVHFIAVCLLTVGASLSCMTGHKRYKGRYV